MVKLKINEKNLVKNLGNSFTNKSNLLTELAQNSRRSGASYVKIKMDEKKQTMIIEDDGCGIHDFQNLLTVAGSGWDEEVCQIENPFGMGFLSAVYLSEKIEVESLNKKMIATRTDILEGNEILIKKSKRTLGTKIILHNVHKDVFNVSAEKLFIGFPTPVEINDVKQEQNKSYQNLVINDDFQHVSFWFGDLFLNKNNIFKKNMSFNLFFQGFSVGTGGTAYSYQISGSSVVHLNESAFNVRMPDRDCLIDQSKEVEKIKKTIEDWQKNEIKKHKNDLEWLLNHYYELETHNLLFLFNEFQTVPRRFLSEFKEDIITCYENNDDEDSLEYIKPYFDVDKDKKDLHNRIIIKNGSNFNFSIYSDENDFALALYLYKKDAIILTEDVPEDHWLCKMAVDLDEVRESLFVSVHNQTEPQTKLDIYISDGKMVLCDSYTIDGFFGKVVIDDTPVISKVNLQSLILIPAQYNSDEILDQVCVFRSEYEYDDTLRSQYQDSFSNWLDIERSLGNPSKIVEEYLKKLVSKVPVLKGKKFIIEIDESGIIKTHE